MKWNAWLILLAHGFYLKATHHSSLNPSPLKQITKTAALSNQKRKAIFLSPNQQTTQHMHNNEPESVQRKKSQFHKQNLFSNSTHNNIQHIKEHQKNLQKTFSNLPTQHPPIFKEIGELSVNNIDNEKTPITFLTHFDTQYYLGANLELLKSDNSFDKYSFFQYSLDTGFHLPHNNKEKQALEFKGIARMKGNMGDAGRYTQTTETPIKIGLAITESTHSHTINRLLIWMRELWLKYATRNENAACTIGFFPYDIGHGFVLGNAHIVGKTIPGMYHIDCIDQFRPGILVSGTCIEQRLRYNLYWGIITTKSDTFNVTAAFTNAQNLDQTGSPERGPWKKNYVFSSELQYEPLGTKKKTYWLLNPYFLFNQDNDQAIEFVDDATSKLATLGINLAYRHSRLTFNFESAFNLGYQKAKHWDRNNFSIAAVTFNTHLWYVNPDQHPTITTLAAAQDKHFEPAPVTLIPNAYSRSQANGEKFIVETEGYDYIFRNTYDRFRKTYKNKYRGWFTYADATYSFARYQAGLAFGFFSGDTPPNDSEDKISITRMTPNITYKDINKNYKGFTGIQQMYHSKAIHTVFLHEAEKLNRPLSSTNLLTQPIISNLWFTGASISYKSIIKKKLFNSSLNCIGYMQHKTQTKGYNMPLNDALSVNYTTALQTDADKKLDRFLGVELNSSASYALTQDLTFLFTMGLFIPGKHYTDAKEKYIPVANQINLTGVDFTGIEDQKTKYAIQLGNDTAILIDCGISWNFDTTTFGWRRKKQKSFSSLIQKNKKYLPLKKQKSIFNGHTT